VIPTNAGDSACESPATEPDVVIGTLPAGHLAPLELWLTQRDEFRWHRNDPGGLPLAAGGADEAPCVASGLSVDEVCWAFRRDDG
jgi:hypothetical protein